MPLLEEGAGRAPPTLARRAARMVIDGGLITVEEIHRHGVRARDLSQSNGLALVEVGNGRGYAAKDMRRTKSADQGSPERELALYRALGRREELRRFAPDLRAYDEDGEIMVLDGLLTSRRFDEVDGGKHVFDPEMARWLGEVLGRWHAEAEPVDGLEPAWPWLLDIDGEGRLAVIDSEPALREVADEIVASDGLRAVLEEARAAWRAQTVIHGDVRFANIMVCRSPPAVRFIDWETSGRGDPAWDVAAAVQEYLSAGISSGHLVEGSPAAEPVNALLTAYGAASPFPMPWPRLRPFVACRLLVRAIQLANWEGDGAEAIAQHLEVARALARSPRDPLASSGP